MGLRWLQLDENYRVSGIADFGDPVDYVLDYDTENNLFGGQIGALLNLWNRGGPLTISGIGKAGLYANHATNRGTFVADFIDFGGDGDTTRAAFVGELGINAKYRLSCHWSVTAGYQALWLGGVALASNQVAYTDIADQTGGVSTEGDVFYHGANVGLEARW